MKRFYLISILFLLCGLTSNAQIQRAEQVAFGIFFNEIFEVNYPVCRDVKFKGYTLEKNTRFSFLRPCFGSENLPEFMIEIERALKSKEELQTFMINTSSVDNISFKRRKAKSKLELKVYNAIYLDDYFMIRLDIYIGQTRLDAYFIKITDDYELIDWCKTSSVF